MSVKTLSSRELPLQELDALSSTSPCSVHTISGTHLKITCPFAYAKYALGADRRLQEARAPCDDSMIESPGTTVDTYLRLSCQHFYLVTPPFVTLPLCSP